jgi:hypothetical protein
MDIGRVGGLPVALGIGAALAAFGPDLTANASTGSNLFDIEPSVFAAAADGAAAAAPADDFGLGLDGLAPGLDSLVPVLMQSPRPKR